MPPLETADHRHYAVLWEIAGRDDYGEPTLYEPVEIRCRWENTSQEALDPMGQTIALDAVVCVSRDIPIGSIMRRGKLVDLPDPLDTLMQVKTKEETDDLKARFTQQDVGLMRFNNTLPAIVGTGT